MATKYCPRCKLVKSINDFRKSKSKWDGLQTYCKLCQNEIKKQWELDNPEQHKENRRQGRKRTKTQIDEYSRQYHIGHKEEISERKKEYYENNKDTITAKKRDNKEITNARDKKRKASDPVFKLRRSISTQIFLALKRAGSSKNGISCAKYLAYTIRDLKDHLQNLFEPWMNWKNWGTYNPKIWDDNDPTTWRWNIDHIIPQSDLPYISMEDDNFKKCWALDNLRPYSAKLNISEGPARKRHKALK
jgi:hypothetical protein